MQRILKYLGFAFVTIIVLSFVAFLILNKPLPMAQDSPTADSLARKMYMAVEGSALDSTNYLQWTFANRNSYLWDRKRNLVEVRWSDKKVLLNLDEWSKGLAFENDKLVSGNNLDVLRGKAWENFCNDSFWLIAPTKVFEKGIKGSIVPQEDGTNALLVSYTTGGVTPGDSYLWHLDADGLPSSYEMWVSIIPIGGVKATWEGWTTLKTGLKVPTAHRLGPLSIPITDVKGSIDLKGIGINQDPFEEIL